MIDPDLANVLSEVARTLQAEHGLEETLQAIVVSAAGTIPGADHVGISAVAPKRVAQTVASTDELVGTRRARARAWTRPGSTPRSGSTTWPPRRAGPRSGRPRSTSASAASWPSSCTSPATSSAP